MIVPNPPLVAMFKHEKTDKTAEHITRNRVVFIDDDHEPWIVGNKSELMKASTYKNFDGLDDDSESVTSVIPALPGWRVLTFCRDDEKKTVEPYEIEVVAWENRELRPMVFDDICSRSAWATFSEDDETFVTVLGPGSKMPEAAKFELVREKMRENVARVLAKASAAEALANTTR